MRRPRVLLADDHTLVLEAFAKLLETDCDVVGTASDGRAVVAAAEVCSPDVVVLDIAMPLLNGLDAGRQIKESRPATKIIYLTVNEDPELAAEAFRAGASGYLLKSCSASELLRAITEALQGRAYVTPRATAGMVTALMQGSGPTPRQLSARQREVLQLLAEGHSMKQVGAILKLTARTVAFHKYRIMDQLGLKSTAELVQFAIKHHIVSP